jgi:hypothetical protein
LDADKALPIAWARCAGCASPAMASPAPVRRMSQDITTRTADADPETLTDAELIEIIARMERDRDPRARH